MLHVTIKKELLPASVTVVMKEMVSRVKVNVLTTQVIIACIAGPGGLGRGAEGLPGYAG